MSTPSRTNIAILGATSHIAKGLIYNYARSQSHDLVLFARSTERVKAFMASIAPNTIYPIRPLDDFSKGDYDVIINCIGIGEPGRLKNAAATIFRLTETHDNMVLDYLEKRPGALYINFSSGAVYGRDFLKPAEESSASLIPLNHLDSNDWYRIAKLNSEAKHRALSGFNIVDLRVFAYFSRFIDLAAQYFLTEIIACIKERRTLATGPRDMVRDFVSPFDLFSAVEKCIDKHTLNEVYDVYSLKPTSKFELLDYFARTYQLQYVIEREHAITTVTGSKSNYFSNNKRAEQIGYVPTKTSLQAIVEESAHILT
jgi:nucleoside-diphosphate-sugar epimerase